MYHLLYCILAIIIASDLTHSLSLLPLMIKVGFQIHQNVMIIIIQVVYIPVHVLLSSSSRYPGIQLHS